MVTFNDLQRRFQDPMNLSDCMNIRIFKKRLQIRSVSSNEEGCMHAVLPETNPPYVFLSGVEHKY